MPFRNIDEIGYTPIKEFSLNTPTHEGIIKKASIGIWKNYDELRLDIRKWKDGEIGKGISLTEHEVYRLRHFLDHSPWFTSKHSWSEIPPQISPEAEYTVLDRFVLTSPLLTPTNTKEATVGIWPNEGKVKLDIRKWDGEEFFKGISLSELEVSNLQHFLNKHDFGN